MIKIPISGEDLTEDIEQNNENTNNNEFKLRCPYLIGYIENKPIKFLIDSSSCIMAISGETLKIINNTNPNILHYLLRKLIYLRR